MRGKILFCLVAMVLLVGVVNADTLILYTDTSRDGVFRALPATYDTFSNVRNMPGTTVWTTNTSEISGFTIASSTTSNRYTGFRTFGWSGDTSSIPDDATIDSATMTYASAGDCGDDLGSFNITIAEFNPASPATGLTADDYNTSELTPIAATKSMTTWDADGNKTFALTDLTPISKTGYTNIYLGFWRQITNNAPTWVSGVSSICYVRDTSYTGTSSDPYLTITYTPAPADTTPPTSITGLANITTCNSINWTWGNPTDADFNHTVIYQDNVFRHNVTNTTTYDLWSSLAELTSYTFSSKTCDLLGNCNTTWTNLSSTTGACGVAPVANFTVDDTTPCIGDTVTFTDTSSNIPTAWHWVVSPGGWDSHLQNTTHVFDTAGVYTINLTASNAYGSDLESKTDYITVTDCDGVDPFVDWPWCADQDIFFRNDSSDIAGYYVMDHRPQLSDTAYKSVVVSSATGPQTIGSWILPVGSPNVSVIGPGLWRFRTYLNVSSAVGLTRFEYIIYNRSVGGVETDLFYGQAITKEIDDLTPTEELTSYARRNYTWLNPGDRLVIKINASTSSVTARTATISLAGNTEASMVGVSYFLCDEVLPSVTPPSSGSSGGNASDMIEIVGVGVLFGVIVLIMMRRRVL